MNALPGDFLPAPRWEVPGYNPDSLPPVDKENRDSIARYKDLPPDDFRRWRYDNGHPTGVVDRFRGEDGGGWEEVFPYDEIRGGPMCLLKEDNPSGIQPSPDALSFTYILRRLWIYQPSDVP